MSIFHVEIHSKDRQIEHLIVPNCSDQAEAIDRIRQFYADRGQRVGAWEKEADRLQYNYLIFQVTELEPDPVIYIAGEYRSQFPI